MNIKIKRNDKTETQQITTPKPPKELTKQNYKPKNDNKIPTKIKKPFLQDNKPAAKIKRIFSFKKNNRYVDEFDGNILFLMKNNGDVEPIYNVQPGEFIINTKSGRKSIQLMSNRTFNLLNGTNPIKAWFCHEDVATPLPEDPIHTSEMMNRIIDKLQMSHKDRAEAKAFEGKGKMIAYIIGAIAVALVLIFTIPGVREVMFGQAQTAAPTVVETVIQNVTTGGVVVT